MFDPRGHILEDIREYTQNLLASWQTEGPPVEHMFRMYEAQDRDTAYLILFKGTRIIFYGIDNYSAPSRRPVSQPANEKELKYLELFCRRGEFDTPLELDMLLDERSDSRIDGLTEMFPNDDETNEDFFLRNAMWLLNPMVH